MKIFSDKMPDLNWKNEHVRSEMIEVGRKWLEMGIDGFRLDAVSHLDRAPFDDIENRPDQYPLDWHKFSNLPKVHDYLKEINEKLFSKYNCLAIGEVGGEASIESGLKYAAFDANELSMVFNFDHNWCNNLDQVLSAKQLKINVPCLKNAFIKWQTAFKDRGWLPLNWLNHDQPRLMSQYGDYKYPLESGKLLATLLYMMRGTPFIYQGEEIGMTNFLFEDVDQFKDISSVNAYYRYLEEDPNPIIALKKAAMRSRDNPRTPMQWSSSYNAGFSWAKPWMPVNYDFRKVNVERSLKHQDSLWHHYQKLMHLRRFSDYHQVITFGSFEMIDTDDDQMINYLRSDSSDTLLVLNNMTDSKLYYDLSDYEVIETVIANYKKQTIKESIMTMKPYESIVLKVKEKL